MILGYHTGGLLLHDEATAIRELATIGYECVVVRPRRGTFNPLESDFPNQLKRLAESVRDSRVSVILDASSRFVHDPWQPGEPSLLSSVAQQRDVALRWIERLLDVAKELGSSEVLISSGTRDGAGEIDDAQTLDLLAEQLERLLRYGAQHGVKLVLRPSTKSFITNVAQYERLLQWLPIQPKAGGVQLALAADVGEMLASGELPLSDRLARHAETLACVFLCDLVAGIAGDQRLGRGDVNLCRIRDSLIAQNFSGAAIVRVEGHPLLGLEAAAEAFELLR